MSEAYERVRSGRLAFKGGDLAIRDKPITKKKKKKNKNKNKKKPILPDDAVSTEDPSLTTASEPVEAYTIDAAKKMKYEDIFPVETKRFGYDPNAKKKSVEEALDDRVKKKADRYCK